MIDETGAVVRGVCVRERAVGHEPVDERPAFGLGVVMRTVCVRKPPERIGDRVERQSERVGRATDVPAERAGRDPHEHHAGLPCVVQQRIESVQPPEGQQVRRAPAAHPDDVLLREVPFDIVEVGHRKEVEMRSDHVEFRERMVYRRQPRGVITDGRAENADPGMPARSGDLCRERVRGPRANVQLIRPVGLKADAGCNDRGLLRGHPAILPYAKVSPTRPSYRPSCRPSYRPSYRQATLAAGTCWRW